jgi:hypothetical protein
MQTDDHKLENIHIRRTADQVIVAKRRERAADGIVTGTVIDLLGFPLLLGGMALGVWVTGRALLGMEPPLLILLGLMFVLFSAVPLYLLLRTQPAFFPYECRFRTDGNGNWLVQRRLGFLASRWRTPGPFVIVSRPAYSRGDWGYDLVLKTGRSNLMLTPPGVFTPSEAAAREAAEHDSAVVARCLAAESRLEKWTA